MRRVITVRTQEKKCQIRRLAIGRAKVLGWPQAGKNAHGLLQTGKDGVRDRNTSPETECRVLATGNNRLLNRVRIERGLLSRNVGHLADHMLCIAGS